jgi:hypothetical protein
MCLARDESDIFRCEMGAIQAIAQIEGEKN